MLQALPLVESGAADAAGLTEAHLALACASHQGAAIHTGMVSRWLADLGLAEADLRCGAHEPYDRTERDRLIRAHEAPCQMHNNCSGKHAGFLTMTRHLKAGPEYVDLDHPLQRAVQAAFEEVTGETSPGYGIDGCSAPNFATSRARAGARHGAASPRRGRQGDARDRAMHRLTRAMATHPELVAGEGRACTELMRAMDGRVAIKTGAEAVFIAIVPEKRLGIALKIVDGASRASEAVDRGASGAPGRAGGRASGDAQAAERDPAQLARDRDGRAATGRRVSVARQGGMASPPGIARRRALPGPCAGAIASLA